MSSAKLTRGLAVGGAVESHRVIRCANFIVDLGIGRKHGEAWSLNDYCFFV